MNKNNQKYSIWLEIVHTFCRLVCSTGIKYYYAQKIFNNSFQNLENESDRERKRVYVKTNNETPRYYILNNHNVILHHIQASSQPRELNTLGIKQREGDWECEEKLPSVKNAFMPTFRIHAREKHTHIYMCTYLPNAPIEIRCAWQDTLITSISQMNGAKVEGNQGIRHESHIPFFVHTMISFFEHFTSVFFSLFFILLSEHKM